MTRAHEWVLTGKIFTAAEVWLCTACVRECVRETNSAERQGESGETGSE